MLTLSTTCSYGGRLIKKGLSWGRVRMLAPVLHLVFVQPGVAQQNLFNIPSGVITPKGKVFFQQQLNIYAPKLESKSHVVYGLGGDWEVGANLVGKGVYFGPDWRALYNDDARQGALYPIAVASLQKRFVLGGHWSVNFGGVLGTNLSAQVQRKELTWFVHPLLRYTDEDAHLLIVAGPYATDPAFVGLGGTVGAQFGFEYQVYRKLYIMGDHITGRTDASVSVLGVMLPLGKRLELCAGWMLPNPNTPKPQALVIELNVFSWDR